LFLEGDHQMGKKVFLFVILGYLVSFSGGEEAAAKSWSSQPSGKAQQEVSAASATLSLTERVKVFKALIRDVDAKSVSQTVAELEESDEPLLGLAMREAMAKTYADIVQEKKVTEQKQKEWLYSMVAINMAYLQFGGQQDRSGNGLNGLIRGKLKEYLPSPVLEQLRSLQNLDDSPSGER
jgi:hypothetical protein